jgi:fatty-acyl-CoA synthase
MIWQHLQTVAQRTPDATALREREHYTPYRGLSRQVAATAALLAGCGVRRGDRVAWLGRNDVAQFSVLFACAQLGAIHLPLNWRLAVPELRFILEDSGATILAADPDDDAMDELGLAAAPPGCRLMWDVETLHSEDCHDVIGDARDPLLLVYTSGTTGRPKGALLTQHTVLANARHAQALFAISPADVVLTVLPLFHVGGLCIQTLPALLSGAAVVMHRRFDPDAFFDSVEAEGPTLTLLVPAIMRALVAHPRWASADFSSLRAVGAGSSDVPLDLIEAFHAKGAPVQQVYGATETGPIAIAQTREEALAAPGSIGRPVPGVEARLAPGTNEILVRGPNVMSGYWNRENGLNDGWFATGDVGRIDAHGRWWFTDRLKHLIISGGENIYPAEVERVLATAPGIVEGAVVGRADPKWGEVPIAVVVPGEGFDAARVLAHFDGRIARFKKPRDIVTVAALPRTALGKVAVAEVKKLVNPAV